jgi:hypothetical protein
MGCVVIATVRQLNPRERTGTNCIGGWLSPSDGLDCEKNLGPSPPPGFDTRTVQPVVNRYPGSHDSVRTHKQHRPCPAQTSFNAVWGNNGGVLWDTAHRQNTHTHRTHTDRTHSTQTEHTHTQNTHRTQTQSSFYYAYIPVISPVFIMPISL